MQSPFEYRSYRIASEDGRYVAKSIDGEPCNLQSRHLLRVLRAVDTLWDSLECSTLPVWFANWMNDPIQALDLDTTAMNARREVRIDHQDQICVLKFPKAPLNLVQKVIFASSAATIMLMAQATKIIAMIETIAA